MEKKTVYLRCVNFLFLFIGFGAIYLMSMHHTAIIYPVSNPFDIDYDYYGYFYSMFLLEPHIKAFYILGMVLLIGKEFFIKKKPIKFKIKTNLISAAILVVLFFVQVIGYTSYLMNKPPVN